MHVIGATVLVQRLISVTPFPTGPHTCTRSTTFSSSRRLGLPVQEEGSGRLEKRFTVYQAKESCLLPYPQHSYSLDLFWPVLSAPAHTDPTHLNPKCLGLTCPMYVGLVL